MEWRLRNYLRSYQLVRMIIDVEYRMLECKGDKYTRVNLKLVILNVIVWELRGICMVLFPR